MCILNKLYCYISSRGRLCDPVFRFILPDTAIESVSRQAHSSHKVPVCNALWLPFPIAWKGLEDQPFTITLKYTDGKWLLDDCTYVEGFADHFCADISEEYDDYTGNGAVTKRYPIGGGVPNGILLILGNDLFSQFLTNMVSVKGWTNCSPLGADRKKKTRSEPLLICG